MKRFLFLPAVILFVTLSGVLFGSSSVNAASDWDGLINVTSDLTITGPTGTRNYNLDWYNESLEAFEVCYGDTDPAVIEYSNLITTEGSNWAVVKVDEMIFIVYAVGENDGSLNFYRDSNDDSQVGISGAGVKYIEIGRDEYCGNGTSNGTYFATLGSNGIGLDSNTEIFLSNFPITYPPGYEGEIIPDSYTPPTVYTDKPDISVVNIVDWKITLQDRNFNTFDNVPFTCHQGLTPVIEYDLFNNDTNERIDQGVFSPTVQYEFQSEKYGIETEYKFIGNYYCGIGDDEPTFSHQTTIYFTSSEAGLYVSDIITDCVLDEFPFVNIENCMNNMADAIQLLSFNTLRLPGGGGGGGGWGVSQTCYNMQVLDDWINSPNQQLCPMFPQYIRDIVTPFVTFALGLLMLNFLTKRVGGGF